MKANMANAVRCHTTAELKLGEPADVVGSGSGWNSVSLDEKSHTDNGDNKDNDDLFGQFNEELELTKSVLRDETEKMIADLQCQTSSLDTLRDELDEKCRELEGLQNERINFVAQLTGKEVRINELKKSFEAERLDLTTSRDVLIDQLEEEKRETTGLRSEIIRLRDSLNEKAEKNDNLEEQVLKIRQEDKKKFDELSAQKTLRERELSVAEKELERLRGHLIRVSVVLRLSKSFCIQLTALLRCTVLPSSPKNGKSGAFKVSVN